MGELCLQRIKCVTLYRVMRGAARERVCVCVCVCVWCYGMLCCRRIDCRVMLTLAPGCTVSAAWIVIHPLMHFHRNYLQRHCEAEAASDDDAAPGLPLPPSLPLSLSF